MERLKQETLEEAAENYAKQFDWAEDSSPCVDFKEGAKWQAERSYSEEDMMKAYYQGHKSGLGSEKALTFKEWLEQFKKK
jgi:hypothetical protein